MQKTDGLALDVLDADITPNVGEIWCSTPSGLGPKASQTAAGFMSLGDKTKLDNMSANGSGDDWVSGLAISAQSSNDQTVNYASGTYMINGVLYTVASGGNYNLLSGFGGVNHYAALSASQRAVVLIYLDTAQVIKSVAGASFGTSDPPMPSILPDTVCLAFILIQKHSNGNAKNITPSNITDCRFARIVKHDESVLISVGDTTPGFLGAKLTNNGNVQFTKENAEASESLKANVQFGTSATTACVGNDARLSNGRTDSNAIHKATSAEISAMTEKSTPVSGDWLVIEDSAASNAKKKVQIGNLPTAASSIVVTEADDATTRTTSSTNYATITGMTITPGAGNFMVWFDASISHSSTGNTIYVSIFSNGVQIAKTERTLVLSDQKQQGMVVPIALKTTVAGLGAGQAIDIRWKTSGATASIYNKSMMIAKY
jgi:hypothetical protein